MLKYRHAPNADPFEFEHAGWAWGWTIIVVALFGCMAAIGWSYFLAEGKPFYGLFLGYDPRGLSIRHPAHGYLTWILTFCILFGGWALLQCLAVLHHRRLSPPAR